MSAGSWGIGACSGQGVHENLSSELHGQGHGAQQSSTPVRTTTGPAVMAMDPWRNGEEFVVEFDLPGF